MPRLFGLGLGLGLVATALALSACGKPAEPPIATAIAPVPAAPTASEAEATCLSARDWQAQGKGEFKVTDSADDRRYELRFTLTQGGQTFSEAVRLPPDMAQAIVNELGENPAQTQVCANRWFIQDLAQERGGSLVSGELADGQLRLSVRSYESGDEESMRIAWGEGGPVLVSSTGKAVALKSLPAVPAVPVLADAPASATASAKTLECKLEETGNAHFLTLQVDAQERVQALSYTAATPGGNCSVDADRKDGATTWRDAPDATTITWPDGEAGVADSASSLRLTREGRAYALNMAHMLISSFCGQSAAIASFIDLTPGQATCTVQERESEPENE